MPLVCDQVTESTDSGAGVESRDQEATAIEQDVLQKATEITVLTEHLEPSGATEPTNEPEEGLDQSTGPFLNDAIIL